MNENVIKTLPATTLSLFTRKSKQHTIRLVAIPHITSIQWNKSMRLSSSARTSIKLCSWPDDKNPNHRQSGWVLLETFASVCTQHHEHVHHRISIRFKSNTLTIIIKFMIKTISSSKFTTNIKIYLRLISSNCFNLFQN